MEVRQERSGPSRRRCRRPFLLGDVAAQPGTKIVFNAPYDDKHTYHIKVRLLYAFPDYCSYLSSDGLLWISTLMWLFQITNSSARRIGWAIKTTNIKRLGVDP